MELVNGYCIRLALGDRAGVPARWEVVILPDVVVGRYLTLVEAKASAHSRRHALEAMVPTVDRDAEPRSA